MQFTAIRLSTLALGSAIIFSVAGSGAITAHAQSAVQPDKPIVLKHFTKSAAVKKKRVRQARGEATSKTDKAKIKADATDPAAAKQHGDIDTNDSAFATGAAGIAGAAALTVPSQAAVTEPAPPSDQASEIHQRMVGAVPTEPKPETSAATPVEAAPQVVAAEEISELDRAGASVIAPPVTLANVTLEFDAGSGSVVTSSDSTAWDKTSLIGRIFIAVGGFLTIASAARMMFV